VIGLPGTPGGRPARRSPDEQNLIAAILFFEAHLDHFLEIGRNVLPGVIGADRQLAMSAVDQNRKLNLARPAEIHQTVECGADCPAREQNVVHQHDSAAVDGKRNTGLLEDGLWADGGQIIPIEGDIERSDRRLAAGDRLDPRLQPKRQRHAARTNSDQCEVVEIAVSLDDLVGDAGNGAADLLRIENDHASGLSHETQSLRRRTKKTPRRRGSQAFSDSVLHFLHLPGLTGPD